MIVAGKPLPLDTDCQAAVREAMQVSWGGRARGLGGRCCMRRHFNEFAAAHELVALSPEQALPVAVVWLKR